MYISEHLAWVAQVF